MGNTTKEKILDAALESFAESGYKGTNLRDFAAGIGLSKSALYKHYESKEDIRNATIARVEEYYNSRFGSADNMPAIPGSTAELKTLVMNMLNFTVRDEKIILTRKILLTEQFRDDRIRSLATEHFNTGLELLFTKIFEGMMHNGTLENDDAAMLAFAFTAPISSLVLLCDREPDKEPEIMQKIEAFTEYFIRMHERKK